MKKSLISSIQSQLVIYFAIATFVPAAIATLVGMKLIYDQVITRAEMKTLSDLNTAREIYRNKINQIENITRLTAARSLIIDALIRRDRAFLQKELSKVLLRENLDVLTLVDERGVVVSRGRNAAAFDDSLSDDPFVQHVRKARRPVMGTDIVSGEFLVKESTELAAQAFMEITPTPKSKQRIDKTEHAGMMLRAAIPLFDEQSEFCGVLLGGVLLNRNFEIVDKINQIVHEGEVYKGRGTGTATIFQDDLRISTNVKNEDGSRAISTLVSEEVYDAVLSRGTRWLGDAFVVNASYIAAYEPIRGIDGRIIGMLYVGILKQPFNDIMWNTFAVFGGVAFGGIVLTVIVAVFQARRISRPLKVLEGVARQIAEGDYGHEVTLQAPDEIEHLAKSINQMAKKLEIEKQELEDWGATLEKRVQERSDELQKIHSQLFRSEKLASLGKLAAGVAHEINNPLTGILTNSSLLLEDMVADDSRRDDVDIIVKETIRCREIVKRLLDFARQTKPQKKLTNVNTLVENIVLLVRNQASFRNVEIYKHLDPNLPDIFADTDQIQQVFINIILNAAEAMTSGGTLTITSTHSTRDQSIVVTFADSGPGIPEERRERIFDPFYTTKEHGTGLGLSISYGIVEQHGGTISVESCVGKGSMFTVQLPAGSTEAGGE
ncbi:MAG: cache domain-containing protein [Ignavibacteriae bacterium]|nr:cache domain-containing protein [Ignavibacteriota bacterium]